MKDGAEYCVYTIRRTKYNVGTVKKESNFIYYFSTEEWNAGDWKEFPEETAAPAVSTSQQKHTRVLRGHASPTGGHLH